MFALSEAGLFADYLSKDAQGLLRHLKCRTLVDLGELGSAEWLDEYSVPIWVAGALSLVGDDQGIASLADGSEKLHQAADSIIKEIESLDGSLKRAGVAPSEKIQSAYLTYWASCALSKYKCITSDIAKQESIDGALAKIAGWAELELSRLISNHHAGLASQFDVVECVSCACITTRLRSAHSPQLLEEVSKLAKYGARLALEEYFEAGSFKLSRPVFADRKQNAILCPTTEVLFMILSSFSKEEKLDLFGNGLLDQIAEAFHWCVKNKRDGSYPPDYDVALGGGAKANIFSTASTVGFFGMLDGLLDDIIDMHARSELRVPSSPPREPPGDYPSYPVENSSAFKTIKQSVQKRVVTPLKDPSRRYLAKFSMILHGPPGTAKTTFAQKLAHDLGWPLIVITQSDFLRSGTDKIDSEAEHVFSQCARLKNTVILFDELEELILSREEGSLGEGEAAQSVRGSSNDKTSRMLTTSMLPKIHDLRDRERSVFIFATNRLKKVDNAIMRLGRFDLIYPIDYPDSESLMRAARSFVDKRSEKLARTTAGRDEGMALELVKEALSKDVFAEMTPALKEPRVTFKDMLYVCENMIDRASGSEATAEGVLKSGQEDLAVISRQNDTARKSYVEALKGMVRL